MGLLELFELLYMCLLPLSGLGQVTILGFGGPGQSLMGRLESRSRAGSGRSRGLKGYDRERKGRQARWEGEETGPHWGVPTCHVLH